MCLAIPGLVEEIFYKDGLMLGKINFAGMRRSVCLDYVPEAKLGDYVLVHVGFALNILDQQEAKQSLDLLESSGIIEAFKEEMSNKTR